MSNDIQKYNNWKAITESDYVTMFIKTWFAFVSTLRELYHKDSLDDIIGKGDSVFINPYLKDFKEQYSSYNDMKSVLRNILVVYKYGREFVLRNNRYIRFFVEDFYVTNQSFVYKDTIEDEAEYTIRKTGGQELVIHLKYLDSKYKKNDKPLIIEVKIAFGDLLSENNVEKSKGQFLDDESLFIKSFATELSNQASKEFLDEFAKIDLSYLPKKDIPYIQSFTNQKINASIEKSIMQMTDYTLQKDQYLLSQLPCPNFIYKVEHEETVDKDETYTWFIKFIYFLRNALFHEIIDPLEPFWQELFKNAYLALKEILDGNIAYLKEKEEIKQGIYKKLWEVLLENRDRYIPNFVEENNNGDLEISIQNYSINDNCIKLKAHVSLKYWCDPHNIKQVSFLLKANYLRKEKVLDENIKLNEIIGEN